jgi:hypothetical protein
MSSHKGMCTKARQNVIFTGSICDMENQSKKNVVTEEKFQNMKAWLEISLSTHGNNCHK